jgi:single-strand DNA-binding protein
MNKVILTGHLGADPTIRLANNGTLVANLSLATNERYTAKDGTKVESPEWHQVVMFSKLAEIAEDCLRKGRMITVEGKLKTHDWIDKKNIKHWSTKIIANRMEMLDSTKGNMPTPSREGGPDEAFDAEAVPF